MGDPVRPCGCTPHAVGRYRGRISGPLLDRIDLHVEVPRPEPGDLAAPPGEDSAHVRARVLAARDLARRRSAVPNGRLRGDLMRRDCRADEPARQLLERAMRSLALSARAHDAVLRVGRTLADLAGEEIIRPPQIAEAVALRGLDRSTGEPC